MSNYPEEADVFVNKTGVDAIGSSDPNNAYDAIEATQGLVGALGFSQSWSTTLMTLLRKYKMGMQLVMTGNLWVLAGEVVLENTNGTKYAYRRNPTNTVVAAANLDIGSLSSNFYYVYAKAGIAATTAPIIFSTNPFAPSAIGTIPYRLLGAFYNSGITFNPCYLTNEGQSNLLQVTGVTNITAPTVAEDMIDMSIPFVSFGKKLLISFSGLFYGLESTNRTIQLYINIDGSDELLGPGVDNYRFITDNTDIIEVPIAIQHLWQIANLTEGVVANTHTIKMRWLGEAATIAQVGASYPRKLTIQDL